MLVKGATDVLIILSSSIYRKYFPTSLVRAMRTWQIEMPPPECRLWLQLAGQHTARGNFHDFDLTSSVVGWDIGEYRGLVLLHVY